ncbi:MAG: EamA/RhaT family transporter, partial [Cetobacterium sp.]
MSKIKKEYIGAGLVSLAATMWGFDGIVLTPRLYQLNV